MRDRLVLDHLELAERCARHVHRRMRLAVPVDDVIQIGREQLVLAAESYQADRGALFSTWMWPKVRFGIIDELRTQRVLRRVREDGTVRNPAPRMLSLDQPIDGTDGALLEDILVDKNSADPDLTAEAHDLLERIAQLPARLRFVLLARLEGYQQPEIARMLGVTSSRASQLEAAARRRIGARTVSV